MDRRKSIKALAAGVVAPKVLLEGVAAKPGNASSRPEDGKKAEPSVVSDWDEWPDTPWVGPAYWGNRLQDWRIENGKVVCVVRGKNRTLHSLVCQLASDTQPFETSVTVRLLPGEKPEGQYAGFRIGAKAVERFDDYRCAAVFGHGIDAGLTADGKLFIGEKRESHAVPVDRAVRLTLQGIPEGKTYTLKLSAAEESGRELGTATATDVDQESVRGNIALVSHDSTEPAREFGVSPDGYSRTHAAQQHEDHGEDPSAQFSRWTIQGNKVAYQPGQVFGPVFFAQYTVNKSILKLTAQLAPIEGISGHRVSLQFRSGGKWKTALESRIDPEGRSAHFRVEKWNSRTAVPYRVLLRLPLRTGIREYTYEGTVAAEPLDRETLKVGVFSCNCDAGFPDSEVVRHVARHKPDMVVFLGDQFYESHGGFRIQTSPPDKAMLDYLRKWYMFGWSYRDIFRHVPCAIMTDDHDMYHGNLWGEGGKHAPSDEGWNYVAQDQGGYKMTPAWVNMVQRTQTSHLPDPYDSRPVEQGIGVYYTSWDYAGVSFAILEDRKFKSAPKKVLPPEAGVANGFITNTSFDIRQHRDIEASLLGDRQMDFLHAWAADWPAGVTMKTVLSQTNFCTLGTLPKGSTSDAIVPRLPIYDKDVYVTDDAPTSDMDSNGWPQKGRDAALKAIRKCFAFHIAGDQHIASMIHYGVDEFGDSGYAFTAPALNNIFPRRWWPPLEGHEPLPGGAPYTGNFYDGFGNRMTVHAVANPRKTGRNPAVVYDRATGYGIVTFDKKNRTIHTECWPRYVDPQEDPGGQYEGWPKTVRQEDNYGRAAVASLPEIQVRGVDDPVVEVISEADGESIYVLRIKGRRFKPKVFARGTYTVRVSDPARNIAKTIRNISSDDETAAIEVDIG